jgi:ubiquitin carboxyl-terminal hydrolase L5
MNGLGNIPALRSGPQLADLMSFAAGMDPQMRGMAITSSDWLREAHNALSPPSAISLDGLGLPKTTEDAYHFVVYLPVLGCLYELDGLNQYPLNHGAVEQTGEGWLKLARCLLHHFTAPHRLTTCPVEYSREVIEARIATYPMGAVCLLLLLLGVGDYLKKYCQLEFSLLALRDDPIPVLQSQLSELQAAGRHDEVAEVIVKLTTENSKRERWAVSDCPNHKADEIIDRLCVHSSKIACVATIIWDSYTRC